MSRRLSKDEFNELVQEIINELHESPEEAVEDAVKQLQARGVPMSSILRYVGEDFVPSADIQHIEVSLRHLDNMLRENGTVENIIGQITDLCEECQKSVSHKVFVGKSEFVKLALDVLNKLRGSKEIVGTVLQGLLTITSDQPDILKNTNAPQTMALLLEEETDVDNLNLLLSWMKVSCTVSERNRQQIVETECIPRLKNVLENFGTVPSIVKGVCSVFRALLSDDETRVEKGHHQEHARQIGNCALITLANLLKQYNSNEEVVGDILLALAAVVTRNEFCERILQIRDGQSIVHILEVFSNFSEYERISRQGLKLLKALAGNDKARVEIVKAGAAPLVVSSMFRHQDSPQLTACGNACIAALTLRSAANSKAFCEVDAPLAILDGMRKHIQIVNVQKQGCRAIRNMVSRCRDICPVFLDLGAEDLINVILRNFYAQCEYDAKSALRDLGCHVEYLDDWFGGRGESCVKN
ncbi:hypothetical protein R5R35_010302 [Gryllus longicercus]|uniref:Armadillo repeat-containing protein 6 n=1 Tax=Gryllus longicercus TaxID=2509291 RepID=A0AAN9V8K5_9ORTH